MAEKIRSMFVFEILGRPPEHIKTCLEQFVNQLGEINGVKILSKKIHEPKPLEEKDAKDLYTTFAEVELEIDNISLVFSVIFHMLPANIEIIEPSEIRLKNFDLGGILSELAVKLHKYDEIAKGLTMERNILAGKLNQAYQKMKELGINVVEVPQNKIIEKNIPEKKNEKKSRKKGKK